MRINTTTPNVQIMLSMIRHINIVTMNTFVYRMMLMTIHHPMRLSRRTNVNQVTIHIIQTTRPRNNLMLRIHQVSNHSRILLFLRRNRRRLLTSTTHTHQLISSHNHNLLSHTLMHHTVLIHHLILNIRNRNFRTPKATTRHTLLIRRQLSLNLTRHVNIRRLTIQSSITKVRIMLLHRLRLTNLNLLRITAPLSSPRDNRSRHSRTYNHRRNSRRDHSTLHRPNPLPPTHQTRQVPTVTQTFTQTAFTVTT